MIYKFNYIVYFLDLLLPINSPRTGDEFVGHYWWWFIIYKKICYFLFLNTKSCVGDVEHVKWYYSMSKPQEFLHIFVKWMGVAVDAGLVQG